MSFRPRAGKKGIRLRLHDLEADLMDVVWSKRLESFSVNDVLRVMSTRREIAYTTVMTTLARLHEKGVLDRKRDGKRYVYDPRFTREQFLQETARELLDGLAGTSARPLALLAERVSRATAADLDELERRIELRRKELER